MCFSPNVVFEHVYPFQSNKSYKKCSLKIDGKVICEVEAASFSEARDLCALEALKKEDIGSVYFNWIKNAFMQQNAYQNGVDVHEQEAKLEAKQAQVEQERNKMIEKEVKKENPQKSLTPVADKIAEIKASTQPTPSKINPQQQQIINDLDNAADFENRVFTQKDLEQRFTTALHQIPTQVLNQFCQKNAKINPIFEARPTQGNKQQAQYITVTLGDEVCTGAARNKKAAKGVACQGMLMMMGIFNDGCDLNPEDAPLFGKFSKPQLKSPDQR